MGPADVTRAPANLPQCAIRYAKAGWPVFPIWPRNKNPLTCHGVKDATTDLAVIARWWRRWPNANIGLAVPRGYLVVDLDSERALHSLKALGLEVPSTSTARTSRGWHFWFEVSQPVTNGVGILPGVDVRASGGYVIVPPSIHSSGAVYRWQIPLGRDSITECPDWLLDRLAEQRCAQRGRSAEDWLEVIANPIPEGRRNQSLAEVAGLLFRKLPALVAAELAYCWAQVKLSPPLPEPEVRRTIDSIAGRELDRQGSVS